MASRPFVKPRGAKYVPVRISAMDTAAPNQMRLFWKLEVFFHAQASCRYSGFRSNAWSIGPEPAPRSSMAASAPER